MSADIPSLRREVQKKAQELRELRRLLKAAKAEAPARVSPGRRTPVRRARAPIPRGVRLAKRSKAHARKLEADCDRLMSRVMRVTVGKCQRCDSENRHDLQWAHGWPRRAYPGVKFDVWNSWVLCCRCHVYMTHRPLEWAEFMRTTRDPESYAALRTRALANARPDFAELHGKLVGQATELGVLDVDGWQAWKDGAK